MLGKGPASEPYIRSYALGFPKKRNTLVIIAYLMILEILVIIKDTSIYFSTKWFDELKYRHQLFSFLLSYDLSWYNRNGNEKFLSNKTIMLLHKRINVFKLGNGNEKFLSNKTIMLLHKRINVFKLGLRVVVMLTART
uniref:Uncharacterized protein n=1 Tax=Glossina palpalis gambiensis TaxID=67801 RepID=A0A1B0C4U8_9MUSC